MRHVDAGGIRIAFEQTGSGPPVVLLHGGLADHREWAAQSELAGELTLIAWDAPGCGASADVPAAYLMPGYADTLAAFIRVLKIDRPCIVGLSFGATLALELAHRHPSLPRALVLASAYAGWAGSLPPDEVEQRLTSTLDHLDRSPPDLAASLVASLLGADARPAVVGIVTEMISDFRPAGARTMAHAMAACDLRPALPAIHVPTLLLHGEQDARSPARVAMEISAAIPGSTLTFLPGAGDQCNLEAGDAFNAELLAFLRSLPPT